MPRVDIDNATFLVLCVVFLLKNGSVWIGVVFLLKFGSVWIGMVFCCCFVVAAVAFLIFFLRWRRYFPSKTRTTSTAASASEVILSQTRSEDGIGKVACEVGDQGHAVLSVLMLLMRDSNGVVPKEFWGLSRSIDLQAPRKFVVDSVSFDIYCQRLTQHRRPYPIVGLRTSDSFSEPIAVLLGVKVVKLGKRFNSDVHLPEGVEKVSFDYAFNIPVERFPNSLRELELGSCFDHPITLPPHLSRLCLKQAKWFNHPIALPPSIKYVAFGAAFNQEVLFSENVEYVLFGRSYDKPTILPQGIKEVHFTGGDAPFENAPFSYPLLFPNSIKKLTLKKRFTHPITLPTELEELHVGRYVRQRLDLPHTLKSLSVVVRITGEPEPPIDLPLGLETLEVKDFYVPFENMLLAGVVPPVETFTQSLGAFPPGLRELSWNTERSVNLPNTLKKVDFGEEFSGRVELPEGLEELAFWGRHYEQRLVLPSTLKLLVLGRYSLHQDLPRGCIRLFHPGDGDF